MQTRYSFPILFLVVLFCNVADAQIQPPNFLCVRNDTLIWSPMGNACGPFVSYEIYSGPTANGPFFLLTSITNQAQTSYYNPVPLGQTVFYFIRSNHNCPGFIAYNSDTLDNQLPESPAISAVSVTTANTIQIDWEPSPSPEVVGYIVYQQTDIGLAPIDTVYGITTFTDFTSNPDSAIEQYTIVALDGCGNAGLFGDEHQTMLLEGVINPCKQSFELNWTPYVNWPAGVGSQEIWASINGGPWASLLTVPADATSAELPAVASGLFYCIRIEAKQVGENVPARSNDICLISTIVEPVDYITLQYATLLPNAWTEWSWTINSEAVLAGSNVQRFDEDVQNWVNVIPVAPDPNQIADYYENANINTADEFESKYRIETTDGCNAVQYSNVASSIFIKGVAFSQTQNVLVWTPYFNEIGVCQNYRLYRKLGNINLLIAVLPASTLEYSDQVDASNPDFFKACYYVVADALITQENGDELISETRSNTACIEQISRIIAPNAFAPRGKNQEFKALILYPELIASYQMYIYDRWGQEVFSSTDPEAAWNGELNGSDAPAGIYTYYIRLVQNDGRVADLRETLTLIR